MRTSIQNKSFSSKIKLLLIVFLRNLRNALTVKKREKKSLSEWGPHFVAGPADSERCVEIPWVASAISRCFGLWLDVGYAHAEQRYWQAIPFNNWRRFLRYGYGLDIAVAQGENPLPVHVVADLVNDSLNPLPQFDLITCISTLEHIGCDNKIYHPDYERRGNPFEIQKKAFSKLISKLTVRGRLFISLPFGKYEDHGWFLQYNADMMRSLTHESETLGFSLITEKYYTLTDKGWDEAPQEEMQNVSYALTEKRAAGVVLLEFSS